MLVDIRPPTCYIRVELLALVLSGADEHYYVNLPL
jgi:hypothetical protein